MPGLPGFVSRVPILRGLARLGSAFAPLATGGGVARRGERGLLGVALVVPVAAAFLSDRLQIMVGLVLVAALLGWLFRGKTLSLHGAEHRAISACEARALVDTWETRARPSRFSRRCGTNFAALSLATALLLYAVGPGRPRCGMVVSARYRGARAHDGALVPDPGGSRACRRHPARPGACAPAPHDAGAKPGADPARALRGRLRATARARPLSAYQRLRPYPPEEVRNRRLSRCPSG